MDCIYGTAFNPTLHDSSKPDIVQQMLLVLENSATGKKNLSKDKFQE